MRNQGLDRRRDRPFPRRREPAGHRPGPLRHPRQLLLADRNFPSVRLWKLFTQAGADLVWRAREPVANRVVRRLSDGSYLAKLSNRKQDITVRVIEYTLPGSTTIYRLLTSLLDPVMAPGQELASLYAERWEIEICYGELRTVQWALRGLRSLTVEDIDTPPGVLGSLRPLPNQPPTRLPGRHGDS